jgi:hypothetical protein
MTINGVEFVQTYGSKGAAINNAGVMTITDATVTSNYFSIWNEGEGELTINGGTYTNVGATANIDPAHFDLIYVRTGELIADEVRVQEGIYLSQ